MMFEMMFLWWCDEKEGENEVTTKIADRLLVRAFKRNNNLNHLREY